MAFKVELAKTSTFNLATSIRSLIFCCNSEKNNMVLEEYLSRIKGKNRNAAILFFANFVAEHLWERKLYRWIRIFYTEIIMDSGTVTENTGPVLTIIKLMFDKDPQNKAALKLDYSQLTWIKDSLRGHYYPQLSIYTTSSESKSMAA